MYNVKKRLVALIMTLVMAVGFSASAFAAEPATVTPVGPASVSNEVSTRATGDQLAFGATTITGGSGTLSVYLSSGNFWADLVAGIGYSSQNGTVMCSVTTPNGTYIDLGTITGSGSRTSAYELFYAEAGTYTFSFFSAMTSSFEVVAYIYD